MSKALVAKNLSTNQMRVDIDNIIKEEGKLYLCQAAFSIAHLWAFTSEHRVWSSVGGFVELS